jgi:hypothetical protein
MNKEKILKVLEDITEKARLEHDHVNSNSDYPCEGINSCNICKSIYEAECLIIDLKGE